MRVLQICLKPPLPAVDGGCKAMHSLTQGLLYKGVDVKVLTVATHKHPFQANKMSDAYKEQTKIESCFIDTRVKPFDAFCNLFTSESYNIKRFYSKPFERLIERTITTQQYDVVLLESLFMLPYLSVIRKCSTSKVIYRSHNVEFEIWQRNAEQASGVRKNYLKILAKRLQQFELEESQKVDAIAAITKNDKKNLELLGVKTPITVIPFGIEVNNYKIEPQVTDPSVFHIGSMDWGPNQDGIDWFLTHIWDQVVESYPQVKLRLAGKNMTQKLLNHKQSNVEVLGQVPDANKFMNENSILVVPLRSGSGMRIKIVEAMALQKLVIATTIAAEGINYTDKENIVIADTSEEFTMALKHYLGNNSEVQRIGENARKLVEKNFDKRSIVDNLVELF